MHNFKLKYISTTGEVKNTSVEAKDLDEAIKTVGDVEKLIYQMTMPMEQCFLRILPTTVAELKQVLLPGSIVRGILTGNNETRFSEGYVVKGRHNDMLYVCQNEIAGDRLSEEDIKAAGYTYSWVLHGNEDHVLCFKQLEVIGFEPGRVSA